MTVAAQQNLGARNLAALGRIGAAVTVTLAFLVAGGAFSLQLSGLDPRVTVGPDSASSQSQIALGLAFAVVILFGLREPRRMLSLLKANRLLLALPALAALSSAWAPEPLIALRRATAFGATIAVGVAVAAALPGLATLRFLVRAAAAGVVLSLAYVAVAPSFAVHQISDGVQSVHAGDWRGLFIHRTVLGQLAALTLAMTLQGGGAVFGSRTLRLTVIAACGLCLVMARSAGGWVSAGVLLAVPGLWEVARRLNRRGWRLLGVSSAALGVVLFWGLAPWLLRVLGKDSTLTGRTPLWSLMLEAARERPLLGYGYSTGFRDLVARRVAAQSLFGYVPNAQNGYLDVLLNLGLTGLVLALATLATGFRRALKLALTAWNPESGLPPLVLTPLLIVVFIAELNVIEAALISANDIFVMIFASAFVASGDALVRQD